ncbi:hypothetical protein QFZ30_001948 [Arthrobacter pascens]|nr:hypothetical protein [Arthrobacter pascens]
MARMTQRRKIHRFHLDDSGTEYPVRIKEDVLAAEEPQPECLRRTRKVGPPRTR